jgi:hypothetical protein
MPKRFMSLLLALIYFSVALGVSSAHDHEHRGPQQCVACAWLAQSVTDVPTSLEFVRPPTQAVHFHPSIEVIALSCERLVHSDRGPPSFS